MAGSVTPAEARKGCLVTFYRNGDPYFKGLTTSVSQKDFPTMETLLTWINDKIRMADGVGVRYIYQLPNCSRVQSTSAFIHGMSYVVSNRKGVKRVSYGSLGDSLWQAPIHSSSPRISNNSGVLINGTSRSQKSSPAQKIRHLDSHERDISTSLSPPLYRSPRSAWQDGSQIPVRQRPRVINVVSNTHRARRETIILNPRTLKNYEDILSDITEILEMEHPPVTSLWTARPPYTKVKSVIFQSKTLNCLIVKLIIFAWSLSQ